MNKLNIAEAHDLFPLAVDSLPFDYAEPADSFYLDDQGHLHVQGPPGYDEKWDWIKEKWIDTVTGKEVKKPSKESTHDASNFGWSPYPVGRDS
jgi:hypothetical protein